MHIQIKQSDRAFAVGLWHGLSKTCISTIEDTGAQTSEKGQNVLVVSRDTPKTCFLTLIKVKIGVVLISQYVV